PIRLGDAWLLHHCTEHATGAHVIYRQYPQSCRPPSLFVSSAPTRKIALRITHVVTSIDVSVRTFDARNRGCRKAIGHGAVRARLASSSTNTKCSRTRRRVLAIARTQSRSDQCTRTFRSVLQTRGTQEGTGDCPDHYGK